MAKHIKETYADSIVSATLKDGVVRVDFGEIPEPQHGGKGKNKEPVVKHRLIMPVQGFANAARIMQELLKRAEEAQHGSSGSHRIMAPESTTKQ